jgi:hypothetical protein
MSRARSFSAASMAGASVADDIVPERIICFSCAISASPHLGRGKMTIVDEQALRAVLAGNETLEGNC